MQILPLFVVAMFSTAIVSSRKERQSLDVGNRWIAVWNSHDVETVLTVFADEVVYEDVPSGEVSRGKEQLRKFAHKFFSAVPDVHLQLERSIGCNDHVTIEFLFQGTDVGLFQTGRRFSVRGLATLLLKRREIIRNRDYYDVATIMRQVGVWPCPDSGELKDAAPKH